MILEKCTGSKCAFAGMKMRIVPESKVIGSVIVGYRAEKIMIGSCHKKKQGAENN
jgi:hypothetical protein